MLMGNSLRTDIVLNTVANMTPQRKDSDDECTPVFFDDKYSSKTKVYSSNYKDDLTPTLSAADTNNHNIEVFRRAINLSQGNH